MVKPLRRIYESLTKDSMKELLDIPTLTSAGLPFMPDQYSQMLVHHCMLHRHVYQHSTNKHSRASLTPATLLLYSRACVRARVIACRVCALLMALLYPNALPFLVPEHRNVIPYRKDVCITGLLLITYVPVHVHAHVSNMYTVI